MGTPQTTDLKLIRKQFREIVNQDPGRGGRPLAFANKKELLKKFAKYLEWTEKHEKPLTVERCAQFLGVTKTTLKRYRKLPEFEDAIDFIRQHVLADKVERLHSKQNVAGLIFDLKNNEGWSDKQEIVHGGEITFLGKLKEAVNRSKEIVIDVTPSGPDLKKLPKRITQPKEDKVHSKGDKIQDANTKNTLCPELE